MCDTMIAMGSITASGRTLLAKNSDREPNEAQYLTRTTAADHAPGAMVRATYVEIPQVAHTHALIGSRPWWMWGVEHGVNEHGLAIGNEAVWSRLPAGREEGLLGMDLLRLTLERAATADEGLAVLTGLVEQFGQSGRCAYRRDSFYHNAFIIADATTAWVVETAGHHWVAKQVRDWASISNVYSIGRDFDRISAGAEAFAIEQGWHQAGAPFDWQAAFADTERPFYPSCHARFVMSQTGMAATATKGAVTLADMFGRLRDHGDVPADWRPGEDAQSMVCMHSHHVSQGDETVAAMVAELSTDADAIIWSSLGSPCLSGFVPVWQDGSLPAGWEQPSEGQADAWWEMERFQRIVERDYAATAPIAAGAFDALDQAAIAAVDALPRNADAAQRAALTQRFAAEQAGAVAALTSAIQVLQAGVMPVRGGDPRGTYLDEVAAAAPDTFVAAC